MIRLGAACVALVLTLPAMSAELGTVSDPTSGIIQSLGIRPAAAEALVADTTMLANLASIDDAGLKAKLPFGEDAVLYFAANGDLLAWSDKSPKVELGYWEMLPNGAYNEFCVRFGHFGLDAICIAPQDGSGPYWLKQRTNGNPFALAAGAAVPGSLGTGPLDLAALAGRVP